MKLLINMSAFKSFYLSIDSIVRPENY